MITSTLYYLCVWGLQLIDRIWGMVRDGIATNSDHIHLSISSHHRHEMKAHPSTMMTMTTDALISLKIINCYTNHIWFSTFLVDLERRN